MYFVEEEFQEECDFAITKAVFQFEGARGVTCWLIDISMSNKSRVAYAAMLDDLRAAKSMTGCTLRVEVIWFTRHTWLTCFDDLVSDARARGVKSELCYTWKGVGKIEIRRPRIEDESSDWSEVKSL
jgi:hypothetical protein